MKIKSDGRKTSFRGKRGLSYKLKPEDEADEEFLKVLHNALKSNWREYYLKNPRKQHRKSLHPLANGSGIQMGGKFVDYNLTFYGEQP